MARGANGAGVLVGVADTGLDLTNPEMLDASGLLWRLLLDAVDAEGRWVALADGWAAKDPTPWYVFNDLHAMIAFVGADRALYFSTGYMANLGVVPALVGRGDAVFADRLIGLFSMLLFAAIMLLFNVGAWLDNPTLVSFGGFGARISLAYRSTVSIGNLSGRMWPLKKWNVKMKPTASSASSPWISAAMLNIQPGSTWEKNTGNQSSSPDPPMIIIPQNTAQ